MHINLTFLDRHQKLFHEDFVIRIRPFAPTDADYAAISAIGASAPPEYALDYEYRDPGDWRALDAAFARAGRPLARYLAEADGQAVAYAYCFEIGWAPPAGRYWCVIRVRPEYARRGLGGQLYQQLLADLRARRARAALLELDDTQAALRPAVERRGFRALLHSWAFALDVRACDLAAFAAPNPRLRGLDITTLAEELARGADWLPALHQLYSAVAGDVPIPLNPYPAQGPEWLAEQARGLPESLPDAFFIVRDGARYAGMSYLHRDHDQPSRLLQRITALHAEYRGRGLALALKLRTIEYAQRHGFHTIRTAVESNNPSMLAINARLGFVQGPGLVLFEKALYLRDLRGGSCVEQHVPALRRAQDSAAWYLPIVLCAVFRA
jgi:RimJ/RimL family protein N-acetyltransferase